MKPLLVLAVAGVALLAALASAGAQETEPPIESGSKVSLAYRLTDDAGAVLDSNEGQAPLTYTQGSEQILPALERALTGMRTGDRKRVTVPPAEGYGDVDPAAVTEVPRDRVPADARTVGAELVARNAAGQTRVVRVKEIRDSTVVIDLNHPLAGKTLHFDVTVVGVETPAK